jgi:multiple sugar transport system ATP-binding protein
MAKVLLKNVTKNYSGAAVVDNFTLEVKDKEFVVLVGPSGCGKSTVLRMIAGLTEVSGGEIYIDDTLVNDLPPKDRNIAMVFQNYALYPNKTVYKNLSFGLEMHKVDKKEIREKVMNIAKMLDIEPYLDRKPSKLSGGQKQRVAIGRALVRDPKVFLMDEPLSNLDAQLRNTMRTEILKLHKSLQTTFIYVTHDQMEAMTLGNRIVVMDKGIIQQADTPDNIYNKPANKFVAQFIGQPKMNFIEAELLSKEGRYYAKLLDSDNTLELNGEIKSNSSKRRITIGIRPEQIQIKSGHNEINTLQAVVDVVERMGSELHVHAFAGNERIILKTNADTGFQSEMPLDIYLPPEEIYVFDSGSGDNIGL